MLKTWTAIVVHLMGAGEDRPLKEFNTGSSAVFILLRCASPNTTGTFDDPIPNDGYCSLTYYDVPAFTSNNSTNYRMIGSLSKFTARAAKRR